MAKEYVSAAINVALLLAETWHVLVGVDTGRGAACVLLGTGGRKEFWTRWRVLPSGAVGGALTEGEPSSGSMFEVCTCACFAHV